MSDLLLQIVIDKLASPLLEKLNDLCSLKENTGKLRQSLPLVLAFLEDAEKRQETEKAIEVWLLELKNVTYESEDLLDELTAEIMLCENHSRISDKVRNLLPFEPSRHLFDLAKELRNKLKELRKIVKRGFSLNFKEGAVFKWSETLGRRTETGSFVKESDIYGREDDRKKIMELLLPTGKAKTLEDVSVIPIVGIGGLGKTTLARLVYNDEKVIQCFDLKIWVYVSQDFDVRKLIIAIINSITRRNCEFSEIDLLQSQLQESLCGRRFLLVLDDVWNEDKKEWDKLGDILKSGVKGSKIIVTTRSTEVASIMGTTNSTYHLKGLLEDDCWALFKKQVFGYGEEEKYPNLLAIGKKIIKKCGGVALAATTLGSQLRSKREEKDWLLVQESEFWNLKQCQSDILPALRLSYIHLPLNLKRCFAFCSLFPKNYEFKKEKLIYIWMAEGLIQPLEGNRPLEDIADEYFNDLLCSSFFQEVEKCEDGNITSYKMHDLIHDLARSIGGNEFVILEDGLDPSNLARTRHSSVVGNFDSFPLDLIKVKHLRTLLCYLGGNSEELPSFLPASFIYLRVFDLSGCGIKNLPESISVLMCLRYLDLSNTPIQTLPHTICNLYNLQTLNLSGCSNLEELPLGMGSLTSLRHLIITGCEGLTRMPAGIGKLVHLQTLPIYIVGKGRGESIAELNSLNLRGELSIKCLENVTDAKEAQKANLREKKHLNMLRLIWGDNNDQGANLKAAKGSTSQGLKYGKNNGSPGSSRSNSFWDSGIEAKDILECLKPHPNLRKLFIKGYPGNQIPRLGSSESCSGCVDQL